jgi:hypothetical protein
MEKPFTAKNAVRVIVRARPALSHEKDAALALRVLPDARTMHAVVNRSGDKETIRQFNFDYVSGPDVSQKIFFDNSGVKTLLDSALRGINCSIFAYGMTGSGKTYTMSGQAEGAAEGRTLDDAAGVIPRAMRFLFDRIEREHASSGGLIRTVVRASCCEIYNEQIYDLLNLTGESLALRFSSSQGHYVQGQLVVECSSIRDIEDILREAHKNRSVSSHALNLDSSRSHSLFSLILERAVTDEDGGDTITTRSKVLFVDLAGSERLKDSKSTGETAGETAQINKSLFTLGKVIAALSERKSRTQGAAAATSGDGSGGASSTDLHVPYRDSKLTRLLQDSLGGSALTVMINCVTPSALFLDESLNTLQYAMRASRIENAPVVQVSHRAQQCNRSAALQRLRVAQC